MLYNNYSLNVKYIFKPIPVVSVLSLVSRQLRFVAVLSKFQQVSYNANNTLVEKFGDKHSNTFVNHCTSIQVETIPFILRTPVTWKLNFPETGRIVLSQYCCTVGIKELFFYLSFFPNLLIPFLSSTNNMETRIL